MSRHDLEIPAIAPELAYGALGATLTIKQGRILLGLIKMRGQNHPHLLLLTISGGDPTFPYLAHLQLVKNMLVLECELCHLALLLLLGRCHDIQIVWAGHAVASHQEFLAHHLQGAIVIHAVCQLHYLALQVGLIDMDTSVPTSQEVKRLGIGCPRKGIHVGIKTLRHVCLLARGQFINAKTIAITLVPIACHALPSKILAIGRETGIGVIPHIAILSLFVDRLVFHGLGSVDGRLLIAFRLAEVLRLARVYII